jgi:hypothetical protein
MSQISADAYTGQKKVHNMYGRKVNKKEKRNVERIINRSKEVKERKKEKK